jgi:hypothetical protein
MSSGIDIQLVRERYQSMSDKEIIRVLTQDAAGLTVEALEVVREEIKRRNLDPNISKGVDAQQKSYTVQEIYAYCELIQNLPCPVTGSTSEKLNATLTVDVVSYIFLTQSKKKIIVASPAILDKANDKSAIKSALLGWWGIPWGLFKTPQAIFRNLRNKKTNHLNTPNDYLRSFVLANIGQIETYKDNKDKLKEIISIE